MALKLDVSKACDRIEWGLVVGMLKAMDFLEVMVNLIRTCIEIVSYSSQLVDQVRFW